MRRMLILLALGQAAFAFSQTAATPTPEPKLGTDEEKSMTREQRIQAHHARIENIIAENRKRQEATQKAALQPQASPTPAVGGPGNYPAPNATQPGQALPPGPVQPARFTPPIQGAPPAAPQAPQGARSEARTILMFRPMDSAVRVGDTFETDVAADTKNGQADKFSFHLKYPTKILNPLALDHSPISYMLKDDIEYAFDPVLGEIFFRGTLKQPTRLTNKALVKIVWEAIAPTDYSSISFVTNSEEMPNGLYLRGTNLLGTLPNAKDGFIESTIVVLSPKSKPVVQKAASGGIVIGSESQKAPAPIISLKLSPSVTSAQAGETFHVDVVLENEGHAPFDHVKLLLKFDPRELEALDSDSGNATRNGINLEDGFAAERFPFQYQRVNEANNSIGVVTYDAAVQSDTLQGSGVLARLHLRAKRAVDSAAVILMTDEADTRNSTDVSMMGSSMLATYPGAGSVVDKVAFSIAEAPAGSLPVTAAAPTPANPFRSRLGTSMQFN